MPERIAATPIAGTPRSQDASAETASASDPAGQDRGQWNAAMMRDVRQSPNPEGSVPTAFEAPGSSSQDMREPDPVRRNDEDWVTVMKQQMNKITMVLTQLQEIMD
eukprot:10076712-Prorocentrum_lima.AAC.1